MPNDDAATVAYRAFSRTKIVNVPVDHGNLTAKKFQDRQNRRPVQLNGFVILGDRRTLNVTVLDLTYDGCCLGAAEELNAAQAIQLAVPGFGIIEAEVRWWKDGRAGLVFAPSEAEDERKSKSRAAERLLVDAEVMQRRQGQPNYRVRLFDVSSHGCKAEFVERSRVGDHIWIKFEGLESLEAEVCWVDGFKAGLKYANPIHPAVFDLLAKRFASAG